MCEYCGCRQIPYLAELMDEHIALLDTADDLVRALGRNDQERAALLLAQFATHLAEHAHREETGVFAALRAGDDYTETIDELAQEHRDFDSQLAQVDLTDPQAKQRLSGFITELSEHIDRENLGLFPAAVVTLGHDGWEQVHQAHANSPTFLSGPAH